MATLAGGLAGGLAGDSTGSAVSGAQAGKVTAENNATSMGMLQRIQAQNILTLAALAEAGGGDAQEAAALALTKKVKAGLSTSCLANDVCVIMAIVAAQQDKNANVSGPTDLPTNTGGDQLVDAGQFPNNTGGKQTLYPNEVSNDTGHHGEVTDVGKNHTGNDSGVPDIGDITTITPISDNPSLDDLIYLNEKIPGLEDVRPENPGYPANQSVVDKVKDPNFISWISNTDCTDCSDIAPKLLEVAGRQEKIIEVRPLKPNTLNVYENGYMENNMTFHQVYTDGRYVYDPRISLNPIHKGDWEKHIKAINPDGVNIS
ncbi:VENN motif pre-toxin domain-containing protein [Enterobacillus tribolii]|uniref:VENN motif pre-toxin domain-containing protein n=1 Tax=Enterobacillus tribolii TaxID=1487935 RepID=UPI001E633F78